MKIIFGADGKARAIYGEEIDLEEIGPVHLRRASHVEPTTDLSSTAREYLLNKFEDVNQHLATAAECLEGSFWWADLLPVNGPVLGPFSTRSEALEAELRWLEDNGIPVPGSA